MDALDIVTDRLSVLEQDLGLPSGSIGLLSNSCRYGGCKLADLIGGKFGVDCRDFARCDVAVEITVEMARMMGIDQERKPGEKRVMIPMDGYQRGIDSIVHREIVRDVMDEHGGAKDADG